MAKRDPVTLRPTVSDKPSGYTPKPIRQTRTAGEAMNKPAAVKTEEKPEVDELFERAATFARQRGTVTPNALKKELRIGAERASRLADQLETAKVVGAKQQDGTRAALQPEEPNESKDEPQQDGAPDSNEKTNRLREFSDQHGVKVLPMVAKGHYLVPLVHGTYAGLYIVLRKGTGNPRDRVRPQDEPQLVRDLRSEGYMASVCLGVDQAIDTINKYRQMERMSVA